MTFFDRRYFEDYEKRIDKAYDDVNKTPIDLREYMSGKVLAEMCDLEKTVSINRLRNYLVMKKLGTDISPPEFLPKSQRPNRRPNMPEKNMDPTWKPGKRGKNSKNWKPTVRNTKKNAKNTSCIQREEVESAQVVPSTSQPVEREPFYGFRPVEARRLLHRLQNELEFMLFLKEAAEKKLIDCDELDFLDPTDDVNLSKLKKTILEKRRIESRNRYPTRNISKINYCEMKEPGEDEYLLCTQCSKKNLHGCCPVHSLPCFIEDKESSVRHARNVMELNAPDNYAFWTTPDGLEVAPSGISGAGYGVWTRQTFLKGTMFGPYRGKKVYEERVAHNSSYAWEIHIDGKLDHYIDAQDPSHSNWMRYVNCSSSESTQNVKALQYCGQIYYCACIDIPPNIEMVAWYGDDYAEELRLVERPSASRVGRVFVKKTDHNDLKKEKSINVDEFPLTEGRRDLECETHQMESRDFNDLISTNCTEEEKCGPIDEDKEKPHRCSQCNKSFKRKDCLKDHVRIHTGEKPFGCSVCGMKFSDLSSRNRHMRIHTGEKPYGCSVCGIKFSDSGHRNRHMRIHTGEKPFGCSLCGMKFSDSGHRSRHERIHTGEKPLNVSRVK